MSSPLVGRKLFDESGEGLTTEPCGQAQAPLSLLRLTQPDSRYGERFCNWLAPSRRTNRRSRDRRRATDALEPRRPASTLKTLGLSASELKQAVEAIDSEVRSFDSSGRSKSPKQSSSELI